MNFDYFILLFFAYLIPMYLANCAPIIIHGKKPLDFGKKLNGKRILGKGKSILGTLAGIVVGSFAGFLLALFFPQIFLIIPNYILLIVLLATGAMLGDIIESFFKRQIGIESGSFLPIFDEIDFILGGFLLSLFIRFPEIEIFFLLVFITIFIHLFTNFVAYKAGLKKVPW